MTTQLNHALIEIILPSELGYEKVGCDAVVTFVRTQGFAKQRIDDLKTALSEACLNAMEHGNLLLPGLKVSIECEFFSDRLVVKICDQGRKAYSFQGPPLTIEQKMQGLGSKRGMGLLLIAGLTDEAGFLPSLSEGNCFYFVFSNQPPPTQS